MKNNLETNLSSYYAQFSVGHEQRRSQLLRSLPAVQHRQRRERMVSGSGRGMSQAWKSAAALAACLMIVVGVIFYVWPQDTTTDGGSHSGIASLNPLSAQEAYAEAMDRMTKIESLHFVWTTPGGGAGAAAEMWWRQPADYRMEFKSNGLVVASQGEESITDIRALFALSQVGRYFLLDQPASEKEQAQLVQRFKENWSRCRIVESEMVTYKGEKCLKVSCVDEVENWRYEYIIDARVGIDTQIPFYEVKQYDLNRGGRLRNQVEVLEVNKDYADSLFREK